MASPKASTPKRDISFSGASRAALARERGITMIEVIVVMGILSVVGGLSFVLSLDNYRGYMFRNEVNSIVGALQEARAQSVSNVCRGATCTDGKPHGVRVNAGTYIVYQAQNGAALPANFAGAFTNRDAAYDQTIKAGYNGVTLNGPNNDIIFDKLSGNATKKRNIIVTDNAQQATTITINDEGQIDWSTVTH